MQLYRYSLNTHLAKWPKREGIIIQEGDRFAEIAPLPGFSKETLQEALADLRGKQITPSVRFALDCLQRPLQQVNVPITSKLKLGHLTPADAIDLVKSHKKKVRVDCNRMWTLSQALDFASAFKPHDFDFVEEPVKTWPELIEFSKITSFPIALDESIHYDWSAIPSLCAIVVKPTILGRIPHVPSPLRLILSSTYESGVGLLHIAQIKTSHSLGLDTVFQDDLLTNPIQCKDGYFSWTPSSNPIRLDKLCAL